MQFVNLKHAQDRVDFATAVQRGLGLDRGLYFPAAIEPLADVPGLLALPFVERSARLLAQLTGLSLDLTGALVEQAFDFPIEQREVADSVHALELFHGPSLAFKDFGARFMAACLAEFSRDQPTTILTATSGDTGAAVAHAFHGKAGVRAVILYPEGRISPLQEKLFCTLGENVHTVAVAADFDHCQALVKDAFEDEVLRTRIGLNSANSINVARLLAQVCYYFESVARLQGQAPVFCVPSGNFGNVTACGIARALGLPMKRILAATNVNDTVPRYLADGHWAPEATVATVTNAMDISRPNNFPRVEALARRAGMPISDYLHAVAVSDENTLDALRALDASGYLADPHSALGWQALQGQLAPGEQGVFLCTAHPAKFAEVIEEALSRSVPLPPPLAAVRDKTVLSARIPADYSALLAELG
ncbi:MAG: threonine synthase [Xanthomonadales bacterium]|nr:threonine synthase [Xanthomonadales bacterium]